MIVTSETSLLFIEPHGPRETPIVDDLTRKICAAWRRRETGSARYRGQHMCTSRMCGAMSDNADHSVDGLATNSLCVHYVACHRSEVPAHDLAKIAAMQDEAEPTDDEITGRYTRTARS